MKGVVSNTLYSLIVEGTEYCFTYIIVYFMGNKNVDILLKYAVAII